jgi:hypothetical protein
MGTRLYLYKVYKYHDSRACSYKQSGILSRLVGLCMEWLGFWLSCAKLCDL